MRRVRDLRGTKSGKALNWLSWLSGFRVQWFSLPFRRVQSVGVLCTSFQVPHESLSSEIYLGFQILHPITKIIL